MFFQVKCSVYIVGHEFCRWDEHKVEITKEEKLQGNKKQTQNRPINGKRYFFNSNPKQALFTTNQGESLWWSKRVNIANETGYSGP